MVNPTPEDAFTDQEVAQAIKDTNQEIFDEAMSQPADDNDGDTSLEEIDDEEAVEPDEAEVAEANAEAAAEDEAIDAQIEQQERDQGRVPAWRQREETERRRAAEAEARARDAENRELRTRLEALERGQKPQSAPTKPDMFADPEGYEKWVLDQAEQRAAVRFEQYQQQREEQRVNENFHAAANGQRSFEFQAAYGKLSSLNPQDPEAQRTVVGILRSSDPAKALFDWWDQNGGEEFRESVRAQLIPNYRPQPQRQQFRANQRGGVNDMQDARQEAVFRLPKSLNGATGSGAHRQSDPELYDNSEDSVFRFATR